MREKREFGKFCRIEKIVWEDADRRLEFISTVVCLSEMEYGIAIRGM